MCARYGHRNQDNGSSRVGPLAVKLGRCDSVSSHGPSTDSASTRPPPQNSRTFQGLLGGRQFNFVLQEPNPGFRQKIIVFASRVPQNIPLVLSRRQFSCPAATRISHETSPAKRLIPFTLIWRDTPPPSHLTHTHRSRMLTAFARRPRNSMQLRTQRPIVRSARKRGASNAFLN